MQLQLINGSFSKMEAIDLITRIVHLKIKFHEDRIVRDSNEEDSKMREKKIKQLQDDLMKVRSYLMESNDRVDLRSHIEL